MEVNSWIFYLICLGIFFILGYYILDKLIFQEYEVKNYLAIFLFCEVFAFSILFLELLIFEILLIGS